MKKVEKSMTDNRLDGVYRAASFLFITQGYGPTQVSHIAKKAGIATGSIYNLFSGKKAILHFVLLRTFNPELFLNPSSQTIGEVSDTQLLEELHRIIDELFRAAQKVSTFTDLMAVIFDSAAKYQVAFNIVNWNGGEFPELGAAYDRAIRKIYDLLEARLHEFIESGHIRPIEHPRLHIRNILENITWWAMFLPYQEADENIPLEKAKEIALDVLNHGYVIKSE